MEGEPTISTEDKMHLAILNNEIVEAWYKSHHIISIFLEGNAKVEHDNKWRTYHDMIAQLEKQRGQAFSMIRGQYMKVLLDNMNNYPDRKNTSESYDPLSLLTLTEIFFDSYRRPILLCNSVQSRVCTVRIPTTQPEKLTVLRAI